ncbi:MAG: DUF169 domain-containing protein [Acidobacteriota bacterium]
MESRIARALGSPYEPVAVFFASQRPAGAARFKEGRWGCVVEMLAFAARGYGAVFDERTVGCRGGIRGLCLGEGYEQPAAMARFLSTGGGRGSEGGLRFLKTPALARRFLESLPSRTPPRPFVVFKALSRVDGRRERPEVVVFLATADETAALVTLAHYDRPGEEAVTVPFASACQAVFLLPLLEGEGERPRAVLGGMDLSARVHLEPGLLTFAVPYALFRQMERNVPGSFLEAPVWARIRTRKEGR